MGAEYDTLMTSRPVIKRSHGPFMLAGFGACRIDECQTPRQLGSPTLSRPSPLAAIDLGSNSFRLEIGDFEHGHIRVLDSLREHVRLAAGLDADKRLDLASQERGLEALARFAQRLQGFDPAHVRAVATNTLRVARNAPAFIARAEQVLGFPVAVIAGREEARLIFSGVAHALASPGHDDPVVDCPPAAGKRLVVDIGGGSTEFCVGRGLEPELMESLYMGSIQYSISHFPDGYIDEFTIKQAELSARRELQATAVVHPLRAIWPAITCNSRLADNSACLIVNSSM